MVIFIIYRLYFRLLLMLEYLKVIPCYFRFAWPFLDVFIQPNNLNWLYIIKIQIYLNLIHAISNCILSFPVKIATLHQIQLLSYSSQFNPTPSHDLSNSLAYAMSSGYNSSYHRSPYCNIQYYSRIYDNICTSCLQLQCEIIKIF